MKQIKDYIRTKTAIHCKTEEEALKILNLLKDNGYDIFNWNNTSEIKHLFNVVKEDLCFSIDTGSVVYCNLNWHKKEGFTIIKASEFLVPELEYGYPVGCLNWAYEVARNEGEVYHKDEGIAVIQNNSTNLIWKTNLSYICIYDKYMTGWYREVKTPKEKLREDILNTLKITELEDYLYDNLKELLKKYEIEKK